jgi:hypothetical protein
LLHRTHEDVPFIIEYPRADNCAEILRRVREYDRQAVALAGGNP